MTSTTIRFEGPAEVAYRVVNELTASGVEIEWVPPPEERTPVVETIVVAIVARGSYDLLMASIARVRKKFGEKAKIATAEGANKPPGEAGAHDG